MSPTRRFSWQSRLRLVRPAQFFFEQSHLFQLSVRACGLFGVHTADGKADVHHDVIAHLSFGNEVQENLAGNAAKLHFGDAAAVAIFRLDDFTRHCQTHNSFLPVRALSETTIPNAPSRRS